MFAAQTVTAQSRGLCLITLLFASAIAVTQESGLFSHKWTPRNHEGIMLPSSMLRRDRGFLFLTELKDLPSVKTRFELHLVKPESQEQVCSVELSEELNIFRISSSGPDSVLFLASESTNENQIRLQYLHVGFVNMTSCKTFMANDLAGINYASNFRGFIEYPNKVDLLFVNHSICGDFESCKVTYNQLGERLDEPVAFAEFGENFFGKPVLVDSIEKGYLGFDEYLGRISYVDEQGRAKVVLDSIPYTTMFKTPFSSLSTQHSNVTFCLKKGVHDVHCAEYDRVRDEYWQVDIETNFSRIASVAVAKSAGIGFRLMLTYCPEQQSKRCNALVIFEIGKEHELVKEKYMSLDMSCQHVGHFPYGSEIVDDNEKVCMHFQCADVEDDSQSVNFYNQCIPHSEI